MDFLLHTHSNIIFLLILSILIKEEFSHALRNVRVEVPHAVRRGARAILKCHYDMEFDSLYSIKWYKGRREFYRYTPKENPAMRVFQTAGVRVEKQHSNESHLILDAVNMATSGKYSCEVSADAPSFHTLIAADELEVVEVPHFPPIISGLRDRYKVGDLLRGNCTSRYSRPAANLTWYLNNEELDTEYIRHYKILRDVRTNMETSISNIQFIILEEYFALGKLKLRCTAELYDVYSKSREKAISLVHNKHQKHLNTLSFGSGTNTAGLNMLPSSEEVSIEHYDQYDEGQHGGLLNQVKDFFSQFLPTTKKHENDLEDYHDLDGAAWHDIHSSATRKTFTVSLQFITFSFIGSLIFLEFHL